MNNFKKRISTLLAAVLIAVSSITSVNAAAATEVNKSNVVQKNKDVEKLMNQYVEELNKQYPFSGSILVSQKGKIVFRKAYGKADYEKNIANTPETKFTLASLTKQFVATGIMLLQENGKLNVKDPIIKYLPNYPNGDKITIENLLTHTSGIEDYLTWAFIATPEAKKEYKPEELINLFKDKPLSFEPGTKFSYCNSNYVLLGYIIEKISGKPCEVFLADNIFKPLGMKNSGFYLDTAKVDNKANIYVRGEYDIESCLKNQGYMTDSAAYAAGGMYSTVDDLYLWHRALSDGKILKKESLDQMYKQFLPEAPFGYGFQVNPMHEQKCISHTGSMPGVDTYILRYIDEDTCIIILGNVKQTKLFSMEYNLYSILHEGKYFNPEIYKEVTVDSKILESYVGKYEIAPGVNLEVIRVGNSLYIAAQGEGSIFYPCTDTKFFHRIQDSTVEFADVKDGKATKAIITNSDIARVECKRVN